MEVKENNNNKVVVKSQRKKAAVKAVVNDYGQHPFFIEKAEAAKAFLLKVGLPKELKEKNV
ncbi:hypothetical protein [Parasediminibacterium sp. JCM 36343]|uniref:hypothetical protein n=1 Tax=Parasediminibacterium sp. JCM 36343 TaxID=3374279 RepID=UPI00397A47AD